MANRYDIVLPQDEHKVNIWFHKSVHYDNSPKKYIEQVVSKFIQFTEHINLNLSVGNNEFYRAICKVICQLYQYRFKNTESYLEPIRNLEKPREWKLEYEKAWFDHLEYYYFDCDFWERFWKTIPECHLDNTIYKWRSVLSVCMPCFILRELSVLEEGTMFEDEGDCADDYDYGVNSNSNSKFN